MVAHEVSENAARTIARKHPQLWTSLRWAGSIRSRVEPPRDAVNASVAVRSNGAEQAGRGVEVVGSAGLAGVDNGGLSLDTVVADGDGLAAKRVGVGVGAVLHHVDGQRDDGISGPIGDAARAKTHVVVGQVSGEVVLTLSGSGGGDGQEGGSGGNEGTHLDRLWRLKECSLKKAAD